MTSMRTAIRGLGVAALAAGVISCGDVVRNGRAPVYVVIDSLTAAQGNHPSQLSGNLTSDVVTNVTSPAPCSTQAPCPTIFNDVAQAILRFSSKDTINLATPTTNNEVTIDRIHVEYKRADGHNTPGVDVPYPFDGAATGTIPINGTLTLGFEIVRHVAKEESPLVQLRTSAGIITAIASVTFYGHDQVGNDVTATGTIQIDFGNFGD